MLRLECAGNWETQTLIYFHSESNLSPLPPNLLLSVCTQDQWMLLKFGLRDLHTESQSWEWTPRVLSAWCLFKSLDPKFFIKRERKLDIIESCIDALISFIKLHVIRGCCNPASTVLATKMSTQKGFPS